MEKQKIYEEPQIKIIHMTETDIITTSSEWEGKDEEGEIILH